MVAILGVIFFEMFLAIRLYKHKALGRHAYLTLVFVLLASNLTTFLYSLGFFSNQKIILLNLVLTSTSAAAAIFFLLLRHLAPQNWIKPTVGIIFLIGAFLSLFVISSLDPNLLNEYGLLKTPPPFNIWLWYIFHEGFWKLTLTLAVMMVVRNMSFRANILSPAFFLGVGASLPLLPDILMIDIHFGVLDIHSVIYVLSALIIGISLSVLGNRRLFLSRSYVVDNLSDGWLLLDSEQRVVDINSSTEHLLGLSRSKLLQKDAAAILSHFPGVSMALKRKQKFEMRTSVLNHGKPTYIHLRLSYIENSDGLISGYLVLLRDDTERRKSDVFRQNVRDEMFSLLHSIAGAASRSDNSGEFINAVMYQMSYTFRSTSTAVFLGEEQVPKNRLLLIAHIGIKNRYLKKISFLDQELDFIAHSITSRKAFLIRKVQREKYMPEELRDAFTGTVLSAPIFADDVFVGLMVMTRENGFFRKDEIARVEIAAQQIGSFVHHDRRKHVASTIAERQRLIRDLHDSVTQRLYGLVMMTEAARAGSSTGAVANSVDFIEQLGFLARQALKEMRLFLYKLQPVDFRGGFVPVLMRRLDAVEGRGGLEVELNIDQSIVMPPEDELHLYMIAQEALNNIIKHANASKINVAYRKIRDHVSLEIRDNGSGFLTDEIRVSGLGFQSMSERTEILGGKMKLSSSPGKGTKIAILVPEKEMPLQEVASR